jgi:Na+/phosphate symporter
VEFPLYFVGFRVSGLGFTITMICNPSNAVAGLTDAAAAAHIVSLVVST